MHRAIAPLSLCAGMLAVPAQAIAQPGEADRVRAALADLTGDAAPGCAAGVFRKGDVAVVASAGAADPASGRPIDADTQFYAASVSKQFTAVAVLQLVVAGKLALNDDIRKHLPEMAAFERPVTIRMLLNHTGGINDSLQLLTLAGFTDYATASREEALRLVLAQKRPNFEPGTRFDYSNGGYLLLSEIVQRVSGQRFARYVEDHVLKPAGMTRSFMLEGSRTNDGNRAVGYRLRDGKHQLSDNHPLFSGSGGLMTTINDLGKWDRDIDHGHKVWTPELLRLMIEPGLFKNGAKVARAGRGFYYASGLMVGPSWFGHSGGARGFQTYFARNHGQRLGVAVLCNRGEIDPDARIDMVAAAIGGGLAHVTQPALPASGIDGRYRSDELDATYELKLAGDGTLDVTVTGPEGEPRTILRGLKTSWTGVYSGEGLQIIPDDDQSGFILTGGRANLRFERIA